MNVNSSPHELHAEGRALRNVQLVRAITLFVIGLFITFTATLHEQVGFDITVLIASLTLLGVVTLGEYWVLQGTTASIWLAVRSIIAFAAAGALLATTDSAGMAMVIAVWAILTAFVTALRLVRKAQPAKIAIPSFMLSLILGIAVLVMRNDAVAVIGLFGAYALLRGVFLGITAVDASSVANRAPTAEHTATEDTTPQPPVTEA